MTAAADRLYDALLHKQVVAIHVVAPNHLQLVTHEGDVLMLEARTESVTGAPMWYLDIGTSKARLTGEALHMLRNIQAVWFGDPNTELRPQAELLAAARADISTLLRYALPGADQEDVAVQLASQEAALWREAHDAVMDITTAEMGSSAQLAATERYANALAGLRAAGLVPQGAQQSTLVADVVDELVAPPPVQ